MTRLEQLEAARRKLPLEGEASSRADRWSRATGERGRRRLGFGLRSAQSAARKGAGLRSGRSQGASSLSNGWGNLLRRFREFSVGVDRGRSTAVNNLYAQIKVDTYKEPFAVNVSETGQPLGNINYAVNGVYARKPKPDCTP
jgi:hypothetical protein